MEISMNELKQQLAELQAKIEKLEEENKKIKRKRVAKHKDYWLIGVEYECYSSVEKNDELDDIRYSTGNYFYSEEEAEKEAEKRKRIDITHQKLKDLADELNGDNTVDFNDFNIKYCLCYYPDEHTIVQWIHRNTRQAQTVYCSSANFKDKAIEKIGMKELVYYLTDGDIDEEFIY